jgi:hypothetical protein
MGTSREAELIAKVQELYAAFGRGDIAPILDALSDDVDWAVPGPAAVVPFFGSWRGRDRVLAFFQAVGEHLTFDHFGPDRFVAQGDEVVVIGKDHARNKKTGRGYQTDFVHVWSFREAKIVRFREYLDTAAVVSAF